jgi:hypothetical protein
VDKEQLLIIWPAQRVNPAFNTFVRSFNTKQTEQSLAVKTQIQLLHDAGLYFWARVYFKPAQAWTCRTYPVPVPTGTLKLIIL